MTDAPEGGTPPPENEAAAQVGKPGQRRDFDSSNTNSTTSRLPAEAGSTFDRKQLQQMAVAIMPRGELRRHVRKEPPWCQRIGADVWFSLMVQRDPDRSEIQLLLDAHARAVARREHERTILDGEKTLRDIARRIRRGEPVPPNALHNVLGAPDMK